MSEEKKQRRLSFYANEDWYQEKFKSLKKQLIEEEKSFSEWVRNQVEDYLTKNI